MFARERILSLVNGQRTVDEIAALAHADKSYVYRILRQFKAAGMLHVVEWRSTATNKSAVYALFDGDDAERPPHMTWDERYKSMLARMTADDRDRRRNRINAKRRKIKIDPLAQALFGVKR